ncbi:MAG: 2-oxoglutarate dehydrogenase complex dihydrolipoyllysine-residue succinyltransferase [Opitutaceae bacterium]|nr:2-oxoglutarate dehydrogenase complex dihydrolipoyllysine-residue succinyltransferase [Opitutaceae bacterium]
MPFEVKIPPMGESINSGVLAKWYVQDGDVVKKDQPLFELETDKITTEGTAETAGRVSLLVAAGTEVKIGAVVAKIDESNTATVGSPLAGAPVAPTSPQSAIANPQSPSVRRLAAETGINPATVTGTGKAGRVTKGDMLEASSGKSAPVGSPLAGAPTPPPTPTTSASPVSAIPNPKSPSERQTRKKLSPLRKRIAERLVQAQHEAAMLTTFNEVDMSAVIALRKKYQDDFVKKHGVKLGFMSFFTKAVVAALRDVPALNAQFAGDEIIQNNYFDIGVAVSTDRGLMVPVLRDCDQQSMAGIEQSLADLAKRAREGKITLPDLEGGVFTITNGGIFGSMLSTPILNAPQAGILGLHAINERPVVVDGQIVIRPMMYLALSYDHRLVDGREAVTFLVKAKQVIEDPARLLIGA